MKELLDYQEIIDELKAEIDTGSLTNDGKIQVLRADQAMKDGYTPIIDWHYDDETMTVELEEEQGDTKEEILEKKMIKEQYEKDQPNLIEMTVEACLNEMFKKVPTKPKKGKNKFF